MKYMQGLTIEQRAWVTVEFVLEDDRFNADPATVDINAPLALIQSHLEGMLSAACGILDITKQQALARFKAEKGYKS